MHAFKINEITTVQGWVHVRRDHGKIIFIDLRTEDGLLQVVITPQATDAYVIANTVRSEWILSITGKIKERPKKMVNEDQQLGTLEMEAEQIMVISESLTPPFEITDSGADINEELRLKYRYLDLRRERMRDNIIMRDKVNTFIRTHLHDRGFIEIETPILTKSTPEGARDFIVPFRKDPGKFYSLPQSPQQYKQLLMVAGFRKYFQLARCMRDEDTRSDRQPEFTQLDIEMSFIDQEAILKLVEGMFTELVKTLYPQKHILQEPWPRLNYDDVMKEYGNDRPDIRTNKDDPNELAFVWILNFPLFEPKKEGGHFAPSHHMFTAPKEEDIPKFTTEPHAVRAYQHDLVLNGFEICGGSIRIHDPKLQEQIFDLIGFTEKDKSNFDHMLRAFTYGVPPHGGIAHGLDRFLAILQNEPTIREVIAFPKTGEGYDPLMNTPAEVSPEQLKELGVTVKKQQQRS